MMNAMELNEMELNEVNAGVELDEEYIKNHPIRDYGDMVKQAFEFAPNIPGAAAEFGKAFGEYMKQQYNEWVAEEIKEQTVLARLSMKIAKWWKK